MDLGAKDNEQRPPLPGSVRPDNFFQYSQENLTMKKTALILMMGCALAAPAMFAQTANTSAAPPNDSDRGAHMVQHRLNYLTTVLSLTSAQQTQVKTVLTNATASGASTHSAMKAAHDALKTAIHSNDAASMEQASNTIGTMMAQEVLAHAKTEAAIYQVLTPEQQTKMTQLESMGPHGAHGFGGPGGPGGPGPGL
jgi:Spy/CpxP family protein refolding chaperone